MAIVRKGKKSLKKSVKKTAKSRRSSKAATPLRRVIRSTVKQELKRQDQEAATYDQHLKEVQELGVRILKVIDDAGYHASVGLDALQGLLITSIGVFVGPQHEQLVTEALEHYHEQSRMLLLVDALGVNIGNLLGGTAKPEEVPTETDESNSEEITMDEILGKTSKPNEPVN